MTPYLWVLLVLGLALFLFIWGKWRHDIVALIALMAVAVSASCAFLTPIGHQSNTLVRGPGGYHFSDYWKLGLPLQIVVVIVAMP